MSDPYSSTEYSQAQIQMQQLALQQQQLELQRQQQLLQRQLEEQRQKLQENEDKEQKAGQDKDGKDDKDGDKKEEGEDKKVDPADAKKRKRRALIVLGIVLVLALIIGVLLYMHARHFEKTDDAYVDGHMAQVAPKIDGLVTQLLVRDNQEVQAGDLLFELDARDQQARVLQAQAQQASAQAQLLQAKASVRTAQANLNKSERDLDRYKATDARAVSRQQLDSAAAQAESDEASLDNAKAQVASAEAAIAQADANLTTAKLQLSYTKVRAPQTGRVTNRSVDVGNYIKAGGATLAIVSHDLWVTANFKETQLDYMKVGQTVDIRVDAYPDAVITGHIDSLQAGSGSVFSSLPAENATGNYVKIVQRVPVKIAIDKIEHDRDREVRLAPGLSVRPRVTVR